MALRKEAGGRPIQSTGEIVAAFAQVSNTAECISVVKSEYEINPMKRKIRKWFEWSFVDGVIKCRELTGRGGWTNNYEK